MINRLKEYGSILGKGLLSQMAPGVAGGVVNELFHQWNITVARVVEDVRTNRSLWDGMTPEHRRNLKYVKETLGNLDFLTADLIIESIKTDFPAVASMLASWTAANEWLKRQVNDLKSRDL